MKKGNEQTQSKKGFNPTITAFFDAPKFGIKDENGEGIEGSAFISAPIDNKAFETLQKHAAIGNKLLLRQARNLNKNGGRTFYLEVLPNTYQGGSPQTSRGRDQNDDI